MNALRSAALMRALTEFDGKHTAPLERFASANPADSELLARLCDAAASPNHDVSSAATWLLKRYGISGRQLSPAQNAALLRLLLAEGGWQAQLHVLQMMGALAVPAAMAAPLLQALAAHASGGKAFLRAWSLQGAAVVAQQHPSLRPAALELLAAAERDAAASVRARLRRTREAFDWA